MEQGNRPTCWASACERQWLESGETYLPLAGELLRFAYERARARISVEDITAMAVVIVRSVLNVDGGNRTRPDPGTHPSNHGVSKKRHATVFSTLRAHSF